MIIPLVLGVTLLAAFGLLAASKKNPDGTPALPADGTPGTGTSDIPESPEQSLPGGDPAGAAHDGPGTAVVPAGTLPPGATPPVAVVPGKPVPVTRPMLSLAAKSYGDFVAEWQRIVKVKVDKVFGPDTETATKLWQTQHGLYPDGIVGQHSWEAALGVPVIVAPMGVAAPVGTGSGAVSVSATGAVDDAFDQLLAAALSKKDIAALEGLAKQAEARGLYDVARSIRAEIARLQGSAPAPTPPLATNPVQASTAAPTGRAILSRLAGSKGADVIDWQKVIHVESDGVFGSDTEKATIAWQKAHGLWADGVVGPKTWEVAYAENPWLATKPRPPVVVTAPSARPLIGKGSTGPDVQEWQRIIGVYPDGVFGSDTETKTKAWQRAHGVYPDGVVGPTTWKAAYAAAPALAVTPAKPPVTSASPGLPQAAPAPVAALPAPGESDSRAAARELTQYLTSIGRLAGRSKEDRKRVAALLSRLGVPDPTGMYGRQGAKAVMLQGFVPVTPYYWPKTGAQAAKVEFLKVVEQYRLADPQRDSEWKTLIAEVNRA